MVGKMLFEGANEAAHIPVTTSRRAKQRQERLCVGRVTRQLEGLLHAVFDGSGCPLDGNREASARIFVAAFDDGRDDGCKVFVAFRKGHRALGLHFEAALLAHARRRFDDDVVERMSLTAALELEPIDDGAGKPERLRLRKHRQRISGLRLLPQIEVLPVLLLAGLYLSLVQKFASSSLIG